MRLRAYPPFRRRVDRVRGLILGEIAERRDATDLEGRDDILSLMVEARHEDGSEMSPQEIRDELMTALGAGLGTPSRSAGVRGRSECGPTAARAPSVVPIIAKADAKPSVRRRVIVMTHPNVSVIFQKITGITERANRENGGFPAFCPLLVNIGSSRG